MASDDPNSDERAIAGLFRTRYMDLAEDAKRVATLRSIEAVADPEWWARMVSRYEPSAASGEEAARYCGGMAVLAAISALRAEVEAQRDAAEHPYGHRLWLAAQVELLQTAWTRGRDALLGAMEGE